MSKKDLMFKAETLNHELTHLEEQVRHLDEQHVQLRELIKALDDFARLRAGDEMLVPLSQGIFAKATFTGNTDLFLNVGQNVVVPKTPEQVQENLQRHLALLEDFQKNVHNEFNGKLAELDKVKEEFACLDSSRKS